MLFLLISVRKNKLERLKPGEGLCYVRDLRGGPEKDKMNYLDSLGIGWNWKLASVI